MHILTSIMKISYYLCLLVLFLCVAEVVEVVAVPLLLFEGVVVVVVGTAEASTALLEAVVVAMTEYL